MKRWIHAAEIIEDAATLNVVHCILRGRYGGFVNDKVWSGTRDDLIQKVVYDDTFDVVEGDYKNARYCVLMCSSTISRTSWDKAYFTDSLGDAEREANDWLYNNEAPSRGSYSEIHYYASIIDTFYDGEIFYKRNSADWKDVEASTYVTASTIKPNKTIQKGMLFYIDGFTNEVTNVSPDHKTCTVKETWISEDTGKPMKNITKCIIDKDGDEEFFYDPKYKEYAFDSSDPDGYKWWARTYATGADNYPFRFGQDEEEQYEEDEYEDDEYVPSATNRDYGPSNPWDAPGMSVKDFI